LRLRKGSLSSLQLGELSCKLLFASENYSCRADAFAYLADSTSRRLGDAMIRRPLSFALLALFGYASHAHAAEDAPKFHRHVTAVFSKLGCKGGACHGAVQGEERLPPVALRRAASGEHVTDKFYKVESFGRTLYHLLGVDPDTTVSTLANRPMKLIVEETPIIREAIV
jgi:hypothetical protein